MRSRTGVLGPGELPSQLHGLMNWRTLTPAMFGQSNQTYFDVAWVGVTQSGRPDASGVYVLVGTGGGSISREVMILSPDGSPLLDPGALDDAALASLSPLTSVASVHWGFDAPGGMGAPAVVASGMSTAAIARASGGETAQDGSNWTDNGQWTTGSADTSWPSTVAVCGARNTMVAVGRIPGAPGTTKRMGTKSYSLDNDAAWGVKTVPDSAASEGYLDVKMSHDGFVLARDSLGAMDGSETNVITSATISAAGTGAYDIAYSQITNEWAHANGSAIEVAPVAWPVVWTTHNMPFGTAAPIFVEALDLGMSPDSDYTGTSENIYKHHPGERWWLTMSDAYNLAALTQDYVTYYTIPLPGISTINNSFDDVQPARSALKFAKDRLFIFTPAGVHVSGTLGFGPYPRNV